MPVEKWHCNPLQTPMVPRNSPYIGFDNQIHWTKVLVPKIIYSADFIMRGIKQRRTVK